MEFQEFSKNYLSILIVLIFQHFSIIIINFLCYHLVRLYKIAINFLMFLNNYQTIKLYIGITTSISFALSV